MNSKKWHTFVTIFLTIVWTSLDKSIFSNAQSLATQISCPDGFLNLNTILCIKFQKDRRHSEIFEECKTQISIQEILLQNTPFNIEFQKSMMAHNITSFWSDFKKSYKDGPFVDLKSEKPKPIFFIGNEDCTSIEYGVNLKIKSVNCNESIYNVCVVESFNISSNPNRGHCKENFMYYPSPLPACITEIYTKGYKGFAEGTRDEIKSFCEKLGGNLLGKGRIYRQNITFSIEDIELPLDFISCDSLHDSNVCSKRNEFLSMNAIGEINTRGEDFVYNATICEHPIDILKVELKLSVKENKIVVSVEYPKEKYFDITTRDFTCFTDANEYYPTRVNIFNTSEKSNFNVDFNGGGYYWCYITNTSYFEYHESNRVFFMNDIKYALNLYIGSLKLDGFDVIQNHSSDKWKNYFDSQVNNSTVTNFLKENEISYKIFFKKIFNNGTLIFHLHASSNIDYNLISNKEIDYYIPFLYSEEIVNGFYTLDLKSFSNYFQEDICKIYKKVCYCISIKEKEKSLSTSFIRLERLKSEEKKCIVSAEIDYVEQVKENIKKNESYNIEDMKKLIKNINTIGNFEENVKVPDDLDKRLDVIMMNSVVNSSLDKIQISESNISVAVFKTRYENPIIAIKVAININESLEIDFLEKDELAEVTKNNTINAKLIVEIPEIFPNITETISTQIYSDETFFEKTFHQTDSHPNSDIISVFTNDSFRFDEDQYIDIHLIPRKSNLDQNEEKFCVFRDFEKNQWSKYGCTLLEQNKFEGYDTCRCNHMTYFAQIIQDRPYGLSKHHELVLTTITYIGGTLSLFGLISIVLTAIVFERWRREFTNKIHLGLSAAIAVLLLIFFLSSNFKSQSEDFTTCLVFGGILHYSVLASFCWMLISAIHSYRKLVIVFNSDVTSHRLLKASLFGWFSPAVPVLILMSTSPSSYVRSEQNMRYALACYPSGYGFWLAVFLPILLIVSINMVFFCLIIYNVFIKTSTINRNAHGANKRKIYVSLLLFFLFGLSWIFGLLSENLIMNYLFCITATAQGLVLFIFFVMANKKTRRMWCEKLNLNYFEKKKSKDTSTRYCINKETSFDASGSQSKNESTSEIPLIENMNFDDSGTIKLKKHEKKRLSNLL